MKWIAEFSDPLLKGITGEDRYSRLSLEWLIKHELVKNSDVNQVDNIFYWCEKLVYELADEIIFTNENQKDYMISYTDIYMKNKIEEKSKIIAQPILDDKYYHISTPNLQKEKDLIYLGYFGSFYVNRGFDTFFDAWNGLPQEFKQRIRLYIYTQQELNDVLKNAPIELQRFIIVTPYVKYLDFLALSKQFDALVLMDTHTEELKYNNPYLPSKLSDYLGSENDVLALMEEGSPLSKMTGGNLCKINMNSVVEIRSWLLGK